MSIIKYTIARLSVLKIMFIILFSNYSLDSEAAAGHNYFTKMKNTIMSYWNGLTPDQKAMRVAEASSFVTAGYIRPQGFSYGSNLSKNAVDGYYKPKTKKSLHSMFRQSGHEELRKRQVNQEYEARQKKLLEIRQQKRRTLDDQLLIRSTYNPRAPEWWKKARLYFVKQ